MASAGNLDLNSYLALISEQIRSTAIRTAPCAKKRDTSLVLKNKGVHHSVHSGGLFLSFPPADATKITTFSSRVSDHK